MSDNRRDTRHVCTVPVEGKKKSVFDDTQVVDFSKGGIGCISKHRIPVNKEVPIEIDLTEDGNPVFVVGRVKWVHRIGKTRSYRIGISFTDVMQGSKSRLKKYFQEAKTG